MGLRSEEGSALRVRDREGVGHFCWVLCLFSGSGTKLMYFAENCKADVWEGCVRIVLWVLTEGLRESCAVGTD